MTDIATYLQAIVPLAIALVASGLTLWLTHRVLERRARITEGGRLGKQAILLGLGLPAILAIVLTLPVSVELRGQLLGFLGIVLSAAVALSATTLLGNALAMVMLRAIRGFQMGDFIRVGPHFGRVSERGLFHTEIQTEDRELTTLPNLYLVSNPVTTIRSSGTIVSATVSLGYDTPRGRIEELLLEAARGADLEDPFIQVVELGDYSVTYRIAGLLTDVNRLISTRSRLRAAAMDALHRGGVEIVSPTFMNQRVFPAERQFVPAPSTQQVVVADASVSPEDTIFDKAEEAERLEQLRLRHGQMKQEIEQLRIDLKASRGTPDESLVTEKVESAKRALSAIEQTIEQRATDEASPGAKATA